MTTHPHREPAHFRWETARSRLEAAPDRLERPHLRRDRAHFDLEPAHFHLERPRPRLEPAHFRLDAAYCRQKPATLFRLRAGGEPEAHDHVAGTARTETGTALASAGTGVVASGTTLPRAGSALPSAGTGVTDSPSRPHQSPEQRISQGESIAQAPKPVVYLADPSWKCLECCELCARQHGKIGSLRFKLAPSQSTTPGGAPATSSESPPQKSARFFRFFRVCVRR